MAIVTGDRYLEFLVRFVDRHAGPLLDGTLTLKLNPVGLHYVQSRLEALQELEGLLAGAPVDYLRAYVSDLGDHRALEQLRRILRLLTSLKVISVLPPPTRDPTPLSLLPFGRLKVLELRGCDLSTSAARGLLELRHTLEKLICHNSTDALRHVFASRIVDIKASPAWNRLSFVSCACNGLVLMDESLQLLPVVETLDLSRNQFAKVANLRKCTKLKHLDLGFNHLRSITSLNEVSCRIVKLVLRNNALTVLRGIENLKTLEGLDLSYNIISNFSELEILASLPCLQSLWLEGNPLCCAQWYRAHVFSFFAHPEKLKLDEKGISTREYWERQIIFASKQKQPSGYGFYFPAKEDAEDEANLNTKKKKHYRLASIEEEEQRRYRGPESVEQESVSCDSDNQRKDESPISDGESKIIGLMNRVEHMKKEQSILWLREFKEWMDQNSENTSQYRRFDLDPGKEMYVKDKEGEKLFGESSRYFPDQAQASEGGCSSNILKPHMPVMEVCTGHSNEHVDANGKAILEPSVAINGGQISVKGLRSEVCSKEEQLAVQSRKPENIIPLLEGSTHPNFSSSTVNGDKVDLNISSEPLTAIDEIMGSRPSSICPGSPPHYQEDILQRRLCLEEEFFQLSAGSRSVVSSDSDTSCSDDDSNKFSVSATEIDCLFTQESKQEIGDNLTEAFHKETWTHEQACLFNNVIFSPDYCAKLDSGMGERLLPSHGKPLHNENNSDDVDCNQFFGQYISGMEKRKGKRKLKRRVITLSRNSVACDLEPEFHSEVDEADMKDMEGQPSCTEKYTYDLCEEASMVLIRDSGMKNPPSDSFLLRTKDNSLKRDEDESIKDFFHSKVADTRASETCVEVVRCECIYQLESKFQEGEVALLRSCKNKLYLLLSDAISDEQGTVPKILGCHSLEELREIVIGLGQQTLRVHMEGDASYLFLPRTIEKSRDILCLLQLGDPSILSTGCSLRSWEQVQVKLLERDVCGSLKMGIILYSMVLFWHDKCEGGSWVLRSLFVIEGCMLVCIEDLVQFSSLADDPQSSPPYYTLDFLCPIQNILEMVAEPKDCRCLTLTLDNVTSGNICFSEKMEMEKLPEEKTRQVSTWKLKWFSDDALLKFTAVLKAIHLGLSASPLPQKCVS